MMVNTLQSRREIDGVAQYEQPLGHWYGESLLSAFVRGSGVEEGGDLYGHPLVLRHLATRVGLEDKGFRPISLGDFDLGRARRSGCPASRPAQFGVQSRFGSIAAMRDLTGQVNLSSVLAFNRYGVADDTHFRIQLGDFWQRLADDLRRFLSAEGRLRLIVEHREFEVLLLGAIDVLMADGVVVDAITRNPELEAALGERGISPEVTAASIWEHCPASDTPQTMYERVACGLLQDPVLGCLTLEDSSWPLVNGLVFDRLIFDGQASELRSAQGEWVGSRLDAHPTLFIGSLESPFYWALLRSLKEIGAPVGLVEPQECPLLLNRPAHDALQVDHVIRIDSRAREAAASVDAAAFLGLTSELQTPLGDLREPLTVIAFDLSRQWEVRELIRALVAHGNSVLVKCRSDWESFNGHSTELEFCRQYLGMSAGLLDDNILLAGDEVTLTEAISMADRVFATEGSRGWWLARALGRRVAGFGGGTKTEPLCASDVTPPEV